MRLEFGASLLSYSSMAPTTSSAVVDLASPSPQKVAQGEEECKKRSGRKPGSATIVAGMKMNPMGAANLA
jgi:hypothetical protein